jgi:hypothetical protein
MGKAKLFARVADFSKLIRQFLASDVVVLASVTRFLGCLTQIIAPKQRFLLFLRESVAYIQRRGSSNPPRTSDRFDGDNAVSPDNPLLKCYLPLESPSWKKLCCQTLRLTQTGTRLC